MAKGCELCWKAARMYCESDEASLCWDCDEKVHGANFLVARHERTLLCQVCRSLTPWKSSGPKLCPTVSVCEACVNNSSNECQRGQVSESQESINDHDEDEDEDDSDSDDEDGDYSSDEDEEYEVEEEEEEGENQVVPWSCASSPPPPPPPPPPSSTSSEGEEEEEEKEELSSTAFSTLKRARVNADLDSDDEIGCSTSLRATGALANEEASSLGSLRARKQRKITTEANQSEKGREEPRSTAIINSLKRLQNDIAIDGQDAAATVLKLSRDQSR
nr:acidic leucine-rich nuclear phosphoprotein 32 family member E-like isoform X1 [Quercus suber]POE89637.1 b-box zinc finger protein 32 [Quercus suber]